MEHIWNFVSYLFMGHMAEGKGLATKLDEFLEKFQKAFDPLPSFLEIYVAIFIMDMVAFRQEGIGQIVSVRQLDNKDKDKIFIGG